MGPHRLRFAASCVAMIGWTALVRLRPSSFFAIAAAYCALWIALSASAGARPLAPAEARGIRARPILAGTVAALVLLGGALGVLWAGCGGLGAGLCAPLARIAERFVTGRGPLALLLLAFPIAPAEELFWRGLVLPRLRSRAGRIGAAAMTAVLSSGVLLLAGEPLLALAALPTSFAWGLLAEYEGLLAAIWSHALWDVLMVGLLPTLQR